MWFICFFINDRLFMTPKSFTFQWLGFNGVVFVRAVFATLRVYELEGETRRIFATANRTDDLLSFRTASLQCLSRLAWERPLDIDRRGSRQTIFRVVSTFTLHRLIYYFNKSVSTSWSTGCILFTSPFASGFGSPHALRQTEIVVVVVVAAGRPGFAKKVPRRSSS